MNKTYKEWLKYYENANKEDVIQDIMLDTKEIDRLNNIIDNIEKKIKKIISFGNSWHWDNGAIEDYLKDLLDYVKTKR